MFTKIKWTALTLSLFFVCFTLFSVFPLKPKDFITYVDFKEDCKKQKILNKKASQSKQYKRQVSRDFWYAKNHFRYQSHIDCDKAIFYLSSDKKNDKFREKMFHVRAWQQDRVVIGQETKQYIHYLKADKGLYSYQRPRLLTDKAEVFYFTAPGSQLICDTPPPEDILMEGTALQTLLSLDNKGLSFKANNLTATLHEK